MRQDWGIRESVGQQGWQGIMRQYLRQDRQEAAKLAAELATAAPATPASTRKQTRSCTEGTEHTSSVLKLLDLALLFGSLSRELQNCSVMRRPCKI